MKLYVGRITARCSCGCDDWQLAAAPQSFSVLSEVKCAACGMVSTYADLALQTPLESGEGLVGATGIEPVAPSV